MTVRAASDARRLLCLMRRHLPGMALGVLAGVAAAVSGIGLMALSGWFISACAFAGLTPTTAVAFNFFFPSIGVRVFAILRTLMRYAERLLTHDATFRILESIRVWFYRAIEPLAPAGLQRFRTADLLNRLVADIDALDQIYLRAFSPTCVAAGVSLILFGLLLAFDGRLAAAAWGAMAVAGVGVSLAAAGAAGRTGRRIAADTAELRVRVVEALQGMAELSLFGAGPARREGVGRAQSALMAGQRRMALVRGGAAAGIQCLAGAALILVLCLGGGLVRDGRMDGANLALVALATAAAFEAVFALPGAYQFFGRSREALRRLTEVADAPAAIVFPPVSRAAPAGHAIDLIGASFRYHPGLPPALDGVDLHVAAGERTAIVGESGAGKSTLAHLIARIYDPERGEVRLGGMDLRGLSESDLRRSVVVLSQQAHLFSTTVRRNLTIARPDASDRDLRLALEAARALEFVDELPEGLDTWVGEGGNRLSTGQARRLAVARAVLAAAPVWVLDEPTEGLDRITEAALVESLVEATRGRTVVWITHRMVSLQAMDAVVVLQRGRVADRGTHCELLSRDACYAEWQARMR
jgi:ATP-binding cassette, subfamily C, bacterial CydC